jgi:DNA-binding beta-propeller fold protein YncE
MMHASRYFLVGVALFATVLLLACGGGGGGGGPGSAGSRFAYVANWGSASVSGYSIDPSTGVLARIDCDSTTAGVQDCPAPGFPLSIAVDPTGKFAYVANYGNNGNGNTVSAYTIDAGTGVLTRISCVPIGPPNCSVDPGFPEFLAGAGPVSVTVDPADKFAYVANYAGNSVSVYSINTSTGFLTRIDCDPATSDVQDCPAGIGPTYFAFGPAGKFAYVTNGGSSSGSVSAYSVNGSTGVLTRIDCDPATPGVQDCPAGAFPQSVAVDPSGKFAYVDNGSFSGSVWLYVINASTGVLTRMDCGPATAGVQDCPAGSIPSFVAITPNGQFAYVANSGDESVSAYSIDTSTGVLTRIDCDPATAGVQDCPAALGPISVTVDPTGKFAYVGYAASNSNGVSAYSINASTGALTKINCVATGTVACVGTDFLAGAIPRSVAITGGVQ